MDIDNFLKGLLQSVSNGPFNQLFYNPIYVSSLITVIVLLIIVSIYEDGKIIKTSFYIFLTCLFIVFSHNKILLAEHRKQLCSEGEKNICNSIGDTRINGGDDLSQLGYLKKL
jgi:hypothetical protein